MAAMLKFRHKPVVIEAIKFTGINAARQADYEQFANQPLEVRTFDNMLCLVIHSSGGEGIAWPGDMIIKDSRSNLYICRADIFAKTYEAVHE